MNLLLLGRGKTGSLVAEVAAERKHHVRTADVNDNVKCAALTPERLQGIACVIDFTAPDGVLANIEATVKAGKNMVVGTTGWYNELDRVRGVARPDHFRAERHHVHKLDAPSGTAIAIQKVMLEASGAIPEDLEITSFREGEVVGLHEVVLESMGDRIYLCHDAKSRRGFAEGAVRAAEWIVGKKGFYNFKDIWREL